MSRFISVNKKFAFLSGLFIGNGWTICDGCLVGFAMPTKKINILKDIDNMMFDIFGIRGHYRPNKRNTCCQLIFYSKVICMLFHRLFGDKAVNKHIPDILITNDGDLTREILRGLMYTDGHLISNENKITYSSTSYNLINQFILLMASIGYKFNISKRVHKKHSNWMDEYKANISGRGLS